MTTKVMVDNRSSVNVMSKGTLLPIGLRGISKTLSLEVLIKTPFNEIEDFKEFLVIQCQHGFQWFAKLSLDA